MIKIVIVDDHDLFREGIRAILEKEPSFSIVGEAGEGQEAIRLVNEVHPDVVLVDISLPGGIGGLEAAEVMVADHPDVKIIILTQYESREYIKRAIRIGAHGYLLKRSVSGQLKEAHGHDRSEARGRRLRTPHTARETSFQTARGREDQP
jgi:two-component system response regulator DegU